MAESKLQSITPILQVTNLQRAIDFYTQMLGFEKGWTAGEPVNRCSLCRDNVEIMLEVDAAPALSKVHISVNGVDAYYARATAAGAKVVYPLEDRFYGMRDCRLVDPDGNAVILGEPLVKD